MYKIGDCLEIEIERLALGGDGIARHQGFVIFVPAVLPQEIVEVEITEAKKDFAKARVLKVVKPSPLRVDPYCPYFSKCGGCNWQHMSTPDQLAFKKELLEENFSRALKVKIEFKTVPSPNPFYYRNRIQLNRQQLKHSQSTPSSVSKNIDLIGYHQKMSRKIVDIAECKIAESKINEKLLEIRKVPATLPNRFEIYMKNNDAQLASTDYGGSGEGFGQINTAVNTLLKAEVIRQLSSTPIEDVLELYSGSGNLTFEILENLRKVKITSVEAFRQSVDIAKQHQSQSFGERNVTFITQVCEKAVLKLTTGFDALVVDPPRAGLEQSVRDYIKKLKPKVFVYISCDPSTLIRDLRDLSSHYKISECFAFDMFPQTSHVESLVTLIRL